MNNERVVSRAPHCAVRDLAEAELDAVSGGKGHYTAPHITEDGGAGHDDPGGWDIDF